MDCKNCKHFRRPGLPCGWHRFTPMDMMLSGCKDYDKAEEKKDESK